jgi:hypothetical protein
MLFNVPQYIDVEDKIAGPFTAKQLLWMFAMGGVLLLMWGFLDKTTFMISAIPVVAIFAALAFYRPHGQPLIKFIVWGFFFAFQPKIYIWKRLYAKKNIEKKVEDKKDNGFEKRREKQKETLSENIESFARTLDSEGMERSKRMLEIIKQNRQKNKK